VAAVTQVWRNAIDSATGGERYSVQPGWSHELSRWAEGQQHTLGAYDRPWR
jgi:putative protease